ncbi:MAG: hypothetical protein ABJE10_01515 [bacterium]
MALIVPASVDAKPKQQREEVLPGRRVILAADRDRGLAEDAQAHW